MPRRRHFHRSTQPFSMGRQLVVHTSFFNLGVLTFAIYLFYHLSPSKGTKMSLWVKDVTRSGVGLVLWRTVPWKLHQSPSSTLLILSYLVIWVVVPFLHSFFSCISLTHYYKNDRFFQLQFFMTFHITSIFNLTNINVFST